MAVNTAKHKCPTMFIGSQQSTCGTKVDVTATGVTRIGAGAGWTCSVGVTLAMVIGIGCAVSSWTRWCMPTKPAAMATISNH